MSEHGNEFYVGYQPRSPRRIARASLSAIAAALALAVVLAVVLATGQAPFDPGTFEFGVERAFTGVVLEHPYPALLVPVGSEQGGRAAVSHHLVAFGKRGAQELTAGLDGEPVRVRGSLVFNEQERMIEVHRLERLVGDEATALASRAGGRVSLGRMTLAGEIVDAKCHLGVMKPGRGKAHRACAVRCISGGIPPVLRVEDRQGRLAYFLLVSAAGEPVNREVLPLVAEPVEITGEVVRQDDRLILRADPSGYRRVGS